MDPIKLNEIKNGNLKEQILVELIKEEAQKRMSYYRQRQDDLIARMSTEWPAWGANIDFFTHFICPFLTNPLCMHFINKSEDYHLGNNYFHFGVYENKSINYFIPKFPTPKHSSEDTNDTEETSGNCDKEGKNILVDFAVNLIRNVSSPKYQIGEHVFSQVFKNDFISFENKKPCFVNIRDGVIGAKAFTAFLEGLIRNASKHGIKKKSFVTKVVFCNDFSSVREIVSIDGEIDAPSIKASNYRYIIVSINLDHIYNDKEDGNSKEKRKIEKDDLAKGLQERLKSELVNNKGVLKTGYWGLKEIKINAAFAANEPIDSVNYFKRLEYLLVGETICQNGIWCDGISRLAYILRLEAPRHMVAILQDSSNCHHQKDKFIKWQNEGVKILFYENVDLFKKNIFTESLNYEIIYIDHSFNDAFNQLPLKEKFPQRQIVGDYNFKLDINPESSMDVFLEAYKQWIDSLVDNSVFYNFEIYFDDDEIAKLWEPFCKIAPKNLFFSFPKKIGENSIGEEKCFTMLLSRHQELRQEFYFTNMRPGGSRNYYYFQHVSGSDPFFSFLLSVNPAEDKQFAQLLLLKIFESTLINILIIDERIAQSLLELRTTDEPKEVYLAEKLYWMGIDVAKNIICDDKKIWSLSKEPKNTQDPSGNNILKKMKCASFRQKKSVASSPFERPESQEDDSLEFEYQEDALTHHILFIHATRLSEMAEHMKISSHDLVKKLRFIFKFVIVHSGRGKTSDIPENAIFMEYSILEQFVLFEPSKFYLIQQALCIKA